MKPVILLRSSWQTVNIGDIAHTPGMLEILTKQVPEAHIVLWPCHVENGVKEMLMHYYPQVEIVEGERHTPQIDALFDRADFLLHGSSPMIMTEDLTYWRKHSDKPYGFGGITIESLSPEQRVLVDEAAFFFARDCTTLEFLKREKVKCPIVEFGPDAAFSMIKHETGALDGFMKEHGIGNHDFLVIIPRLRYSPYHLFKPEHAGDPVHLQRHEINLVHQDADLAAVLNLTKLWIKNTGKKVVLCPEMVYEMQLNKEQIYAKLTPQEQSATVVYPEFWLPDRAIELYRHAHTLVSMEMHSPIMSLAAGIPSFYLQLPTDSCKGQMWNDIGLADWIYRLPEKSAADIWPALARVIADYPAAQQRARDAMALVAARQRRMAQVFRETLTECVI